MRKKYDSSVIFLYMIGKEHILPRTLRRQIPYSTISTWRKEDFSRYVGHEFRTLAKEQVDLVELHAKFQHLKNTLAKLTRSWLTLAHLFTPVIKTAGENKLTQKQVLKAIEYLKNQLGLEKTLRVLNLSKTQYNQWSLEARFECFDSFSQLCVKRHPQQLGLQEILGIKKLLTDPRTDHWPIVSIAGNALRKKEVVASLYSWYKYARLFGIFKKPSKKQRKTIGLVATVPNEYWHVDTTLYELLDGQKVCISFVMDNYSKMILGFYVSTKNNFVLVKRSLRNALKTVALHQNLDHSYLVTDGGTENHNQYIDQFISKLSNHKITKVRALKDIRFSNSPVEAVHRSIKGRYLRNRKFESIGALKTYLEWAVNDYNVDRPHYKHRPRTPAEVYFGKQLDFDLRERTTEAIRARVTKNKCAKCLQCSGLCKTNT